MRRPKVAECLNEIERLKAENARLQRLALSRRPELPRLRALATTLRDLGFNLPRQLEELHREAEALLGGDDDLPSFDELYGILSDGKFAIDAALESGKSADAVDPHVTDPGKPSTRD